MKWHIDPAKLIIHNKLVRKYVVPDDNGCNIEEYSLNGKLHNPNGPAYTEFHSNGTPWVQMYLINGKRHREDGHAYIATNVIGITKIGKYYLDNEELSPYEYNQAIIDKRANAV